MLVFLENLPNMTENIWCEQIDTTVDNITYKRTGFLHKMEHLEEKKVTRTTNKYKENKQIKPECS